MITDPNARAVYVEYLIDQVGRKTVLVVETDLQLDAMELDFEAEKVEALCNDLDQHRAANAYLDAVRLIRRDFTPSEPVKISGTFGHGMAQST